MRMLALSRILSTLALLVTSPAFAQPSLYEVEPNNTPAEATEISGEVVLIGTMESGDQDAYKWTVSDVDAQKRWTLELQGIQAEVIDYKFPAITRSLIRHCRTWQIDNRIRGQIRSRPCFHHLYDGIP